jgi:S1-C subfamily serine protease
MTKIVRKKLANQTVALVIEGPMGNGQGSGILVSLEGLGLKEGATVPRAQGPEMVLTNNDVLIVTCEHCIPRGARAMPVELPSGHRFMADALVVDGRADVALMKIRDYSWDSKNGYANKHDLSPVKVGKSSKIEQGANVLAVGAPLMAEYRFSMTEGIISKEKAYNSLSILPTFLISAQINPGNSGGLLATADTHEWIGMNSSGLFGAGGGNRGLNHAIRADEIRFWIHRMIFKKHVVRDGITSVVFMNITPPIRGKLGLETNRGAFISGLAQDDPGIGAALKRTDVVLQVRVKRDGKTFKTIDVESPHDCIYALQLAAGQEVEMDVWRQKSMETVSFTVPMELMPFSNQASFDPFGMEVQTYRKDKGVQVTNIHPQCPLYPYIQRYDVITGVEDPADSTNFLPVTDYASFYRLANAHGTNLFLVETDDQDSLLPLERIQGGGQQHITTVAGIEFAPDIYDESITDEPGLYLSHLLHMK